MESYIIICLNKFRIIDKSKLIGIGRGGGAPHVLKISQFRCIHKTIFTTTPLGIYIDAKKD